MHELHTILGFTRMAMSNLAKADRILRHRPPSKQLNEISIEKSSEELSQAALKVVEATTEFYQFCKNKANIDFLEDLKL